MLPSDVEKKEENNEEDILQKLKSDEPVMLTNAASMFPDNGDRQKYKTPFFSKPYIVQRYQEDRETKTKRIRVEVLVPSSLDMEESGINGSIERRLEQDFT